VRPTPCGYDFSTFLSEINMNESALRGRRRT
jgi:hypothetical protein